MPRFVFKLEPVLEARKRAEEAVQRRVAQVERERLALEDDLRRQQAVIGRGKDEWRDRLVGAVDMDGLRLQAAASLHAVRRAQQLVVQLAGVHSRLEAVRAELLEATKRRRAMELLRDRRFERWKADMEKAETARLDDLAAGAAYRERTG